MTKDADFVRWVEQQGPPPQIRWVTVGNTSNARMKEVLEETLMCAEFRASSGASRVMKALRDPNGSWSSAT